MKYFDFGDIKLDLTYITNRLIVIGSPYRNDNLNNLKRYLDTQHANHYRLLNFTNEQEFNLDQDMDQVETYPVPKGNPLPFSLLIELCSSIEGHFNAHEQNVVVLHSADGKLYSNSCIWNTFFPPLASCLFTVLIDF
ncbi:hypothetical protein EON64_16765 [archaeon]|nr:MAG: hypothetical protein EON64_16765 [archaeon]